MHFKIKQRIAQEALSRGRPGNMSRSLDYLDNLKIDNDEYLDIVTYVRDTLDSGRNLNGPNSQ
jgi:hypothetical protein